jgi:two-component system, LytTR family, response regulator
MDSIKKLTLMIVEDEKLICQYLTNFVEQHFADDISICGVAHNTSEAKQIMEIHKPDIALFDIHIPTENAIEFLKKQTYDTEIIFVTAYDEFALDAFKLHALNYLTKPIDDLQLKEAIGMAIEKINMKNVYRYGNNLATLNETHSITLVTQKMIIVIRIEQIIYVEAKGVYCAFFYEEDSRLKSIIVSKPLSYYESVLQDKWMRIHRSYLINTFFVESIKEYHVYLKHDIQLEIAKRRKGDLKLLLKSFR